MTSDTTAPLQALVLPLPWFFFLDANKNHSSNWNDPTLNFLLAFTYKEESDVVV